MFVPHRLCTAPTAEKQTTAQEVARGTAPGASVELLLATKRPPYFGNSPRLLFGDGRFVTAPCNPPVRWWPFSPGVGVDIPQGVATVRHEDMRLKWGVPRRDSPVLLPAAGYPSLLTEC